MTVELGERAASSLRAENFGTASQRLAAIRARTGWPGSTATFVRKQQWVTRWIYEGGVPVRLAHELVEARS